MTILCRLLPAFLMAATVGCASGGREPSAVVLRNGTAHVLDVIRVQEVTDSPLDARRFGHFTSVPPGSNQYVARRKDPPPLPDKAVVIWKTMGGREQRQPIDLNAAVSRAKIPRGILVIEVLPNNTAHAFVTARPD
jgi:hypothetical protein